jgi:dehydrogenase/reductase SDR family member 1
MRTLAGRIAVVTGGTAGVGRGIASELAHCGARVFVTGRSIHDGARDDSQVTGIRCDHREDEQVAAAFERVAQEAGAIDILVNNVWGGYEQMMEDGVFTWSKPFWEQPLWRWDAMFDAGVRAHYYASQLAARSMVASRREDVAKPLQKRRLPVRTSERQVWSNELSGGFETEAKGCGFAL